MSGRVHLTVELLEQSDRDLRTLAQLLEMNRTTALNRAIQTYLLLERAIAAGGAVFIQEAPDAPINQVTFG